MQAPDLDDLQNLHTTLSVGAQVGSLRSKAEAEYDRHMGNHEYTMTKTLAFLTIGVATGIAVSHIVPKIVHSKLVTKLMRSIRRAGHKALSTVVSQSHSDDATVTTVVLTGGPCGGKTSAKNRLTKDLKAAGYNVLFCPEVRRDMNGTLHKLH
jgi:hydrogenase maturation factor HypF (carbamoyltransferase family)